MRVAGVAALLAVAGIVSMTAGAEDDAPTLRITSPLADTIVTGPTQLEAFVYPDALVDSVTFFVDGRLVCKAEQPPFRCMWDAGVVVRRHHVRVVCSLTDGRRLVGNMRTKDVGHTERVHVEAVLVPVIVTDRGRFVRGLQKQDFLLSEDGVRQPVASLVSEEAPLDLVVAIDISGSMEEESRIEGARVAAVAALKELKLGRDRIGIVAFDDQVDIVQPLASLDSSVLEQCEFQINRLAPRGGTIIAPPTMAGLEMFANKSAKGSKILMVMTDGMDEQLVDPRMKTQLVDGLSESSDSQGAPVYTISFGSNEHPDAIAALRYIADRCSGKYYHAPSGAELAEIYRAQVQELEGAFTVTYNSPYPAADGLPRKVDVAVATPSGDVSAQSSYEIGPIIAGARRTAAPVTSAVSEGTEPAAGGSTFLKLMLFVVLLAALVGGLYASTVLPIFTQLSSGAATAAAGPTPPGPATGTPSSSTTPPPPPPPPPPPTGVPSRSQQQPAAKPPAAQSSASPKPVTKPASPSKPPPPPPPPGGRPKRQ